MGKDIIASDAVSLWATFSQTAQFHDDHYDANLEKQIRCDLKLPTRGQMLDLLKKKEISVEELLTAILNAMKPFSQMLNDLLRMFEQASAQSSNTNLRIEFDFNKKLPLFQFKLDYFKKTVQSSVVRFQRKTIRLPNNCWQLVDSINIFNFPYDRPCPESATVCKWLDEYRQDTWPVFMPEMPESGYKELDHIAKRIWGMVEGAISYYKQAYDPAKGRVSSHLEGGCQYRDDFFWSSETNFWTESFIRITACTMERLAKLPPKEKVAEAKKLVDVLKALLDTSKMSEKEVVEIIDCLEDILSLPFWKRRYDLYAAWILAEIADAMEKWGVQFHVQDGVLSFPFHATRMATCENLNPPLAIWAELRTKSSKIIGRGRSKHIQPDYSLTVEDPSDIHNTVAVIECKQYKGSHRKNFFEAIYDYTNGRPDAKVFLVNYGPISKTLLNGNKQLQQNAVPIERVYPDAQTQQIFKEKLENAILEYYRRKAKKDSRFIYPWENANAECCIQLQWEKLPQDLDLILKITDPDGTIQTIGYFNDGENSNPPHAWFDKDCRSGYGTETIRIVHWMDAEYDIIIDNFSGESELDGVITVNIECGLSKLNCCCTELWGPSSVWIPFHLNSLGVRKLDQCMPKH